MLGVIFGVMDLELESTIFETDVAVHDALQRFFGYTQAQAFFLRYIIGAWVAHLKPPKR